MRRHLPIAAAAMLSAAAIGLGMGVGTVLAAADSPQERVDAAYKAMGMTDAKSAPAEITTLVVKGSMQTWDPGESESVSDPYKPDWGVSTFTESWDRARGAGAHPVTNAWSEGTGQKRFRRKVGFLTAVRCQ
jgi:hypothetical protein